MQGLSYQVICGTHTHFVRYIEHFSTAQWVEEGKGQVINKRPISLPPHTPKTSVLEFISYLYQLCWVERINQKRYLQEFPGGLGDKGLMSLLWLGYCHGFSLIPSSGTPPCLRCGKKKKKTDFYYEKRVRQTLTSHQWSSRRGAVVNESNQEP